MRRRLVGAILAVLLLLAACGGASAAAEKACMLLMQSSNDVNRALYYFDSQGGEDARSLVKLALAERPEKVADAFDAAPAELAAEFSDVKRYAAMERGQFNEDLTTALYISTFTALRKCESVGVDVQVVDVKTGELGPL